MSKIRPIIKLIVALLALWLGLIWAKFVNRPAFLDPSIDIEPLTFILATVAGLMFGFWKTDANKASSPTGKFNDAIRDQLIANLKARYEKRLKNKLGERHPVNLVIKPTTLGLSDESKENIITYEEEEISERIGEIFDRTNGRLLLIGLKGAGKTTILLKLATELLKRTEQVPVKHTIPVFLNLATWRSDFKNLDTWLNEVLPIELGASKSLTADIRANTSIVLLLDGLDEIPDKDRNSYIEALGDYGRNDEHRYVMTSRTSAIEESIEVRNFMERIEVVPLTVSQIEANIAAQSGAGLAGARALYAAIKKDDHLKESLTNPFYLNTAQLLFASGKNWSDFGFSATDTPGRQKELVEKFVQYALNHDVKRNYEPQKTERWLKNTAKMMEEMGVKNFELTTIWKYFIYLFENLEQKMKEETKNYQNQFYRFFLNFLSYFLKNIISLFILILTGNFINSLLFSLIIETNDRLLIIKKPYQRFLFWGILPRPSIIFHFLLRISMLSISALPFQLVYFLNEMSRRHLLEFDGDLDTESGGGSWRWRHSIIQDYFSGKTPI